MSSAPPVESPSSTPRTSQVAVRILLAIACVATVAVAGLVLYKQREPAGRDASGAVVDAGRVAVTDLRVGDCVDESFEFNKRSTHVRAVPCDSLHQVEVYATTAVSGGAQYPGTTEINNRARAACAVHQLPAALRTYPRWFIHPDPRTWDDGGRWVVCMLSAPTKVTGAFSR